MAAVGSGHRTCTWRSANADDIAAAASALRSGRTVAFPTETVYGLGADARNDAAVRSVFEAKGRPADNPLIVHFASKEDLMLSGLVQTPLRTVAEKITSAFWPGPLTLVLPCAPGAHLSSLVTAGLDSVAVRVPNHPVARALLAAAGIPIAAPSANRSGRPSPTTAAHVLTDLKGRISGILDDASAANDVQYFLDYRSGLESTVVDLLDDSHPAVLRPGSISATDLERVAGVAFHGHTPSTNGVAKQLTGSAPVHPSSSAPRAPGMKYRHYAPRAQLVLCKSSELRAELKRQRSRLSAGESIGLLADSETCAEILSDGTISGVVCVECGRRGDAASVGRALYSSLRAFDGEGSQGIAPPGVSLIVAVALEDDLKGVGSAVMNRLLKAASASTEEPLDCP
jgi:L-threonylcarbamoyladenylate synthase